MPKKIVITGGSGYVAQNLRKALAGAPDTEVLCLSRMPVAGCKTVQDYAEPEHYAGADVVIHCAALAHIDDNTEEGILQFFRANTELPDKMAKILSEMPKPPRLIFFSSIGAREAERKLEAGYRPANVRKKHPYQLSKLYAERTLASYAPKLDITCLRPPLIYGPGAPGNLGKLISLIQRGWPLPTGMANAPRGYCYIGNLMSAVEYLVENPQGGFHIYEVGDAQGISTRGLVMLLGKVYERTPRQLPIPPALFRWGVTLLGQEKLYSRLFEPLSVDNTALNKIGWQPLFTLAEGLASLKSPGVAAPKIAL